MNRLCLLVLVGAIFLPLERSEAQLLFGSRLGEAHYAGDDTKIVMQVGADLLRTGRIGDTRTWNNPQTGHHGDITLLRSYEMKGLPCRDVRVDSQLGDKRVNYVLPVCRTADDTWKFAAR